MSGGLALLNIGASIVGTCGMSPMECEKSNIFKLEVIRVLTWAFEHTSKASIDALRDYMGL